jgi:hypothetical protein
MSSLFTPGAAGNKSPGAGPQAEISLEEAERLHMARASIVFSEKKWETANTGDRGEYEAPGDYVERLEKLTLQESTNPESLGVNMVIVEKTILKVIESFEGKEIGGHTQGKPSRVGERVTQMFMFNKIPALPAFKSMLAKIYDMPKDMIPPSCPAMVTGPRQPLAGTVVRTTKKTKPASKSKNLFTYVDYHGALKFSDLKGLLDEGTIARYYPNGQLDRLIAAEQAAIEAAKAAEQAQPAQ